MNSNADWQAWGALDPLFGVASVPAKTRDGADPWNDAEFESIGATYWAHFLPRWSRYGLDTGTCLEIGCGAGRMTKQLCATFGHVHGVDVSADMIAAARPRCGENVSFHVTDGLRLPLPDASVNAVFSCHVFQHFDRVSDGLEYFSEIYRVMAPGATLMVHLPLILWPAQAWLYRIVARMKLGYSDARALLHRRLHSAGLIPRPIMRMTYYEADALVSGLERIGFAGAEVSILYFDAPWSSRRHPFVFARKDRAAER